MSLLADATVAVPEIAVDPAPSRDMLPIIRPGQSRALGDTEVRFDGIEPGGLGRRPHGVDVQPAEQRQEARMVVDVVQVIHDDEQSAPGIAGSEVPERFAHVADSFPAPNRPLKQSACTS